MKTTITIEAPAAILRSNLDGDYIGIPVNLERGLDRYDLAGCFYDKVSEQAGEGVLVETRNADEDPNKRGYRTYDLLLLDNKYRRDTERLPRGNWIVRYTLDPDNATSVDAVWMAAKISK